MSAPHFDLAAAARLEMFREGFHPDFPPGTEEQIAAIRKTPVTTEGLKDLRWVKPAHVRAANDGAAEASTAGEFAIVLYPLGRQP